MLIVICEIHQFQLHFSHGVLLLRSVTVQCTGRFSRAFRSYFRVRSSYKKCIKKTKNLKTFFKNLGFFSPGIYAVEQ